MAEERTRNIETAIESLSFCVAADHSQMFNRTPIVKIILVYDMISNQQHIFHFFFFLIFIDKKQIRMLIKNAKITIEN